MNVADDADAVAAALQTDRSRVVLNITAEPVRYRDYLSAIADSLGVPPPPPDPTAAVPRSGRGVGAAARDLLGWTPRRPILPPAIRPEA